MQKQYKREIYLKKIRPYYDIDLIKVLTGIRRSGKSVILQQIQEEIKENGIEESHIIKINFENLDFAFIQNAIDLHNFVKEKIKDDKKYYIFLDEIQNVIDFEKALSSFRASFNCSVFVTGSTSTLLSGELATLLTGRTVEFKILPFSYFESCEYKKILGDEISDDFFFDYLKWGGFPLRFELQNESSIRFYLEDLFSSIKYKDIISKKQVDKQKFDKFSSYFLANCGQVISFENLANFFNANNAKGKTEITKATLYSYCDFLEKAFLIQSIQRYDIAGKNILLTQSKNYASDTGLCTINTNTVNFQDTFFLENIIFNELLLQDFKVFYAKNGDKEIDFVAIKDGKKCFIQVSYYLSSQSTIEREFGAFNKLKDNSPKYVLSLDKIDFSQNGITHINIIDFLLGKKNLFLS